jgi:EmrB/QacA subfamily drug resistance transporter
MLECLAWRPCSLATLRPMADLATSPVVDSPSAEAREDPGRSRVVVALLALTTTFLSTIDATIVATALPAIRDNLHTTINWAGWTITVYSLGVVLSMPTAGRLANQLGQRRVFLWALALFTTGSLFCGLSTNIYELIAFRALQSFGGGALNPTAAGIISTYFGKGRDRAIGLFSSIAAVGQFTGPVLGGLFVGYLNWHWIFFVNVPIGITILVLVPRFISESRARGTQRIDFTGMSLLAVFILFSTLMITNLGDRNVNSVEFVLVPAISAAVALALFIRHNCRVPDPFVPLHLLYGRGFGSINLINFLWGFAGWGMATLVPLYAQDRYRLPALNSGTLLSSRGVTMFIFGFFAAMTLRRSGYRLPMIVGYLFTVAGMLMMVFSPQGIGPFGWLAIAAGLTGVGNGLASPSSRNAGLELVPDEVASTTGLRFMFNSIGTIFSVSIVTAILNRSSDPGLVQAHIILVMAAIIGLVMVPLVRGIPEHKGEW